MAKSLIEHLIAWAETSGVVKVTSKPTRLDLFEDAALKIFLVALVIFLLF